MTRRGDATNPNRPDLRGLPPIAGPSPQPRRGERRPTPDECYTIEVFAVYIHAIYDAALYA